MPALAPESELVERTLSDPARVSVSYRDFRATVPLLLIGLLAIAALLWADRRQQFHCSRSTGLCVLREARLAGDSWRREVPLSSVVSIAFYKVDSSSGEAKQGLELNTTAGPIRWAAVEPCAPGSSPCPGAAAGALAAIDAFLKVDALPEVRAEYGGQGRNLSTAAALLGAFLAASVIGWQRVSVTVSLATRRVVVSKRSAVFPTRIRSLAFDTVREATFSNTRLGTKRSYAAYLVTDDDYFELARAPSRPTEAQRFVDDLNRALRGLGVTATTAKQTRATLVPAPTASNIEDPIVIRSAYRGWTALVLAMAMAVNALVLFGDERQELHCSRRSASCRLETHRVLSTDVRSISLARVTGVALYKLPQGKNSVQGLQLLTDAAPEALPASQGCRDPDLDHFCIGGTQHAYAAIRAFLADSGQEELHTGYGVIGKDLPVLDSFFGLLLLGTLIQWQSFRVAVSASGGSVSILRRRAAFFLRRFELDLSNVNAACFDEKRDPAKAEVGQRAQLLMKDGDRIWLSRAWTTPSPKLRRFVTELDAALVAARQRVDTHSSGRTVGLPGGAS